MEESFPQDMVLAAQGQGGTEEINYFSQSYLKPDFSNSPQRGMAFYGDASMRHPCRRDA